jgi:hypothetical protein
MFTHRVVVLEANASSTAITLQHIGAITVEARQICNDIAV